MCSEGTLGRERGKWAERWWKPSRGVIAASLTGQLGLMCRARPGVCALGLQLLAKSRPARCEVPTPPARVVRGSPLRESHKSGPPKASERESEETCPEERAHHSPLVLP